MEHATIIGYQNPLDRKVFVGGLHWQSNEQSLWNYFVQFGEIEQVKLILDKQTGRSKGYGFVIFTGAEAAQRSVANGWPIIDGKKCNCNLASLGLKADGTPTTPQPEKRKRNFQEYGGGEYQIYDELQAQAYGDFQAYQGYQEVPGDKRRKVAIEQPQVTYIQQMEQEGRRITIDDAKAAIEQNRDTEPTEAYKFFLEVSELFRNTPDYEVYYKALLDSARRVRVQQAIQDGQTSGLVAKYPQV